MSDENTNTTNNTSQINFYSIFVLIVALLFVGYKYILPRVDTSWVVDAAVAEVKSDVYSQYGEIPSMSGELIYKNGQDYIVIVKYTLPEWKWKASCACHVYGYRKSNVSVMGMTNELGYDYKYGTEELKALWGIE